ncbi:MAG: hypothetical protein RIK87_08280 [Fuerstiella sp.]
MTDTAISPLADLKFRNSAHPSLRKAAAGGDAVAFSAALQKSLAAAHKRFEKRFSDTPFVAAWSAAIAATDSDRQLSGLLADVVRPHGKKRQKQLQPVIDHVAAACGSPDAELSGFSTIVAAELMLRYMDCLTADQTVTVFCRLARVDAGSPVEDPLPATPQVADSISQLIAGGEVAMVLSLLQESLSTSKSRHGIGARQLAGSLEDATDTDGTLRAALARRLDEWLAPFVRVAGWAKAIRSDWAGRKMLKRWDGLLKQTCLLVTPDGFITQPGRSDFDAPYETESGIIVLHHALRLSAVSAGSAVRTLVGQVVAGKPQKAKKRTAGSPSRRNVTRCSEESDWAESAVLRNALRLDADVMQLDWDEPCPHLNLTALGTRILEDRWQSSIRVNGELHQPAGDWVCTCWFEDKEVVFAELESGSENGIRHVRHAMLALQQHFAVLTDTVTSPDAAAQIEFASELQLAAGTTTEANTITRELLIHSDGPSLRAVPTWLEDDRVCQAAGALSADDRRLQLSAVSPGGVTLPLVLDWHPERVASAADWNRLTVTEERRRLTARDAAAFRVRIGNLQLMLFRSLRRGESLRAVLGHHTPHETVYGRVRKNGTIAPLVMVDSDA